MNEKSVEKLATLLKTKPDVVKDSLEDESKFDGILEVFNKGNQVFSNEEITKKLENNAKDAIDLLGTDGKPLPSNIYNLAKGNAFEKQEKIWAKKYGVEEWKNIDDLQDQILAKNNSGKADGEKDTEIERLKKLVLDTEEEKNQAMSIAEKKFNDELVSRDVERAVGQVNIDADGEKLQNQTEILNAMFRQKYKFEFRDGQTIVSNGDGILKNKVGDPLTVQEVLIPFAEKYVDIKGVPEGGRGGSSTSTTNTGINGIKNAEDFYAYAKTKEIEEGTEAFFDLMQEVMQKKPDLKL